jgi:PAS domain S-box-containing protein
MHRLLKRQLKQHLPDWENLPKEVLSFFEIIENTYQNYDADLEHLEHILKVSSQELFIANKELNALNKENETLINYKTQHLKKIQFTLESAEKIASFCAINIDLNSSSIELSPQFKLFFNDYSNPVDFDLNIFLKEFSDYNFVKDQINQAIVSGEHISIKKLYYKNYNQYYDLDCEILNDNLNNKNLIIVLNDVTDRVLLELHNEFISNSLNRYVQAINASAIVSEADANGVITNVNETFCRISGYSKEELIGKKHNILNSGYHDKAFFHKMYKDIYSGKIWKEVVKNKRKDGEYYWVDSTIVPFYKDGKIVQFISIRFDITEKMEYSLKISSQRNFYEGILNNLPIDIAVFNEKQEYLFLNPYAVKSKEVREFLINKTDRDYCIEYNKDLSIFKKRKSLFEEALQNMKTVEFTDEVTTRSGTKAYILRRFFPLKDIYGNFDKMMGYGIDITEKILNTNAITESLKEKEALLGEIHHRVKNNLALIVGLIELQKGKIDDEVLRNYLQIILGRVNAVALIHEKLYKSNNFSKINLIEYITEFANISFNAFDKSNNAKLNINKGDISLSTKQAIPIALLLNEIMTNFLKYVAKDTLNPLLSIEISKIENQVFIKVFDNGPGLNKEIDVLKIESLGFKLLFLFLKQLKAKYNIYNNPGFTLEFNFDISEQN